MDEYKKLKKHIAAALSESNIKDAESVCVKYGAEAYTRYFKGEMLFSESEEFFEHAEKCEACLKNIQQLQNKFENEVLYSKTIEFMDAIVRKKKTISNKTETY